MVSKNKSKASKECKEGNSGSKFKGSASTVITNLEIEPNRKESSKIVIEKVPSNNINKNPNCCVRWIFPNIAFEHDDLEDFYKPQTIKVTDGAFIAYITLVALGWAIFTIFTWLQCEDLIKWYMYLCSWALCMTTIQLVFYIVVLAIHICRPASKHRSPNELDVKVSTILHERGKKSAMMDDSADGRLPMKLKILWFTNNVSTVSGLATGICYWALYQEEKSSYPMGTVAHIMMIIWVTVKVWTTSIPYRLLHCYHALLFALAFIIFSLAHNSAGGTNIEGKPYIYTSLDWTNTNQAVVTTILMLTIFLLSHILLWLQHRLKLYIASCHPKKKEKKKPAIKTTSMLNIKY